MLSPLTKLMVYVLELPPIGCTTILACPVEYGAVMVICWPSSLSTVILGQVAVFSDIV